MTQDGAPRDAPANVIVQPAYEWMLDDPASA